MFALLALFSVVANAESFEVSDYTAAPLQVQLAAQLDAPPAEVFDLVSTGLSEWMDVSEITWDNEDSATHGQIDDGSSRSCALGGKKGLTETIPYWEDDHLYAYQMDWDNSDFKLPLRGQLGTFEVSPDGDGGTVLVWSQYFERKVHPMSPMIPGFMRKKMGQGLDTLIGMTGGEVIDPADAEIAVAAAE